MQLNEDFIEQISDEDVQQQESQIDGDYSFVMTFFDDNGIHDFELGHLGRLISSLCETMPFIVRYKVDLDKFDSYLNIYVKINFSKRLEYVWRFMAAVLSRTSRAISANDFNSPSFNFNILYGFMDVKKFRRTNHIAAYALNNFLNGKLGDIGTESRRTALKFMEYAINIITDDRLSDHRVREFILTLSRSLSIISDKLMLSHQYQGSNVMSSKRFAGLPINISALVSKELLKGYMKCKLFTVDFSRIVDAERNSGYISEIISDEYFREITSGLWLLSPTILYPVLSVSAGGKSVQRKSYCFTCYLGSPKLENANSLPVYVFLALWTRESGKSEKVLNNRDEFIKALNVLTNNSISPEMTNVIVKASNGQLINEDFIGSEDIGIEDLTISDKSNEVEKTKYDFQISWALNSENTIFKPLDAQKIKRFSRLMSMTQDIGQWQLGYFFPDSKQITPEFMSARIYDSLGESDGYNITWPRAVVRFDASFKTIARVNVFLTKLFEIFTRVYKTRFCFRRYGEDKDVMIDQSWLKAINSGGFMRELEQYEQKLCVVAVSKIFNALGCNSSKVSEFVIGFTGESSMFFRPLMDRMTKSYPKFKSMFYMGLGLAGRLGYVDYINELTDRVIDLAKLEDFASSVDNKEVIVDMCTAQWKDDLDYDSMSMIRMTTGIYSSFSGEFHKQIDALCRVHLTGKLKPISGDFRMLCAGRNSYLMHMIMLGVADSRGIAVMIALRISSKKSIEAAARKLSQNIEKFADCGFENWVTIGKVGEELFNS